MERAASRHMASKAIIQHFEKTDKRQIKGKVGHSRTGACTSKGRCFHGNIPHRRKKGQ